MRAGESIPLFGPFDMSVGPIPDCQAGASRYRMRPLQQLPGNDIEVAICDRSSQLEVLLVELAADGAVKITVGDSEAGDSAPATPEQLRKLL
jgi:hypothetical protein